MMKEISRIILLLSFCALAGYAQAAVGAQQNGVATASTATAAVAQKAVVDQYCAATCHSARVKTAGLSLQGLDLTRAHEDAEIWERVIRKVRAGLMPPPGARRPERATLDGLAAWLETEIDSTAAAKPAIIRPGVHRMNRTEY